jgi:hypothetical protein
VSFNSAVTDLDLSFQIALETPEQNLALRRLQAIHRGRNGPDVVGHREQDEFTINEVIIGDFINAMVDVRARLLTDRQYAIS